MQLGIRLHLAGLSLPNTIREIDNFGVERSRKVVQDWVQKADLQSADDASPYHVALDETVIRISGQQFWLYAAVDSETILDSCMYGCLRRLQCINTVISAGDS